MAMSLNPYLSFDGTAREAMTFYADVLGGELALTTFGEFGAPDPADADRVMHGVLTTPSGFTLMGADVTAEMPFAAAAGITVSLSGDDAPALRGYWARLAEGGSVQVPLEPQVWGDEFGMCVDRFGTPWMVDITPPREG